MKIYNITDKEYEAYGRVLTKDYQVDALVKEMEKTPAPDHVIYIASDAGLEALDQAKVLQESFFGGMPIQVGYCNGTNHKLDACEYHRCSELGVAITDLILLLGKLQDVTLEHIMTQIIFRHFLYRQEQYMKCMLPHFIMLHAV